ncbi:MAG TPA: TIGR03617 family F420-dependent LLM class oxidoreductase [Pseudonocardia sp.]
MKVYAGMKAGLPLARVPDYARRIEELGFDGLRIPETLQDPLLVATLAVEHTQRLEIGTGVMLAFPRSPMVTAMTSWELQRMSGGRFMLGLGSQVRGNIVGRFSVPWSAPVPLMRDYISSLRAIWNSFQPGQPLNHVTENYSFTRLQPFFNPGPIDHPDIPVHLGGVGVEMCELAGAAAEGIITHPTNSSHDYLDKVVRPALAAGASAAGRPGTEIPVVAMVPMITGTDAAALARECDAQRRIFALLYSTPNYAATLRTVGLEELGDQLHALSRRQRWADMAALVTDDMLEVIAPIALHDDLAPALLRRYTGLTSGLLLMPPQNPMPNEALREIVRILHAGT